MPQSSAECADDAALHHVDAPQQQRNVTSKLQQDERGGHPDSFQRDGGTQAHNANGPPEFSQASLALLLLRGCPAYLTKIIGYLNAGPLAEFWGTNAEGELSNDHLLEPSGILASSRQAQLLAPDEHGHQAW